MANSATYVKQNTKILYINNSNVFIDSTYADVKSN